MNQLARKLAHLLAENSDGSFYEDEARYGLEIALGALFQFILILGAALLLGIGKEVLVVTAAAALYIRFSGGPHCDAYYKCTVTSLVTYILLGYISRYIPPNYFSFYITLLLILSGFIIYFRVPVDNPTKRITDEAQIKRLKLKSALIVLLLAGVAVCLVHFREEKVIATWILLGLFWQNLILLPCGDMYINFWNQFLARFAKQINGEEVMKC